jgi:delta8-fatty-acid desaturase
MPFFAVSEKLFQDIYSSFHKETLSVTSSPLSQFLISFQHLTYYVILFFGRFNLYAQSYIHLFRSWKQRKEQASCAWTPAAITCCGVFWLWYGWLLSHLPSIPIALVYIVLSNGLTSVLHVQITLSHWAMPCDDHKLIPDNDKDEDVSSTAAEEVFASRNLRTTMDVDCPVWMDWFHGGLQYQVTHHLYPRLPRHNLRLVRGMVEKEICEKHQITYHHHKFVAANRIVVGSLYDVAKQVGLYVSALHEMAEKARTSCGGDKK